MKRRIAGLVLALALVLTIGTPFLAVQSEAAESVYFTAVNDTLCPLNDETMPFWSGGNLYVTSTVLSSYDLGISYARDTSAQTAFLYNSRKILEFDLENGGANNKLGTYYSASAVSRRGYIYFPLAFVSSYFGLSYSVTDTAWAPLIRVRSDSAVLSDNQFIDAASSMLSSRYNAYEQSKKPSTLPNTDKGTENNTSQNQPTEEEESGSKTTARVLLAVRAGSDETMAAMLNTLDRYGYKATFFFEPGTLEGRDDLLRRIVSSGHRLGLIQTGSTEELQSANEQLRLRTGTVTRMVLSSQKETAQNAGYMVYSPTVSAENLGSTASGRAARVMDRIEKSTGSVKLLLGGDDTSASALNTICTKLYSGKYTVRAVNEVACG